ncbi:MAG: adenosine kinase, adenosine kinase [Candidatus Gottesmanbacteria bacterium GW2011_GWA2_43_14]|uniref:Adenosine kinase, adenosine kinase n=1 Tax=Candidatus Gottesmanbacteria bacterium GW2011_GWA2_43_14 TaxID=1618443 RepID=A0A0G1DIG0_9BACT|nr:MAG: adenosine kinase, adenosine kinase [Candidatus Gottesmanbacteria bacterium GW2011_GWA2_43_14]
MIIISGSLAYDQIMDFPGRFSEHIMPEKLHILNLSFLVDTLRKGFGGTAGNIAYSLSLLGNEIALCGTVGRDFAPYRKFLNSHKISTGYVKEVEGLHTSSAFGITDSTDNQIWGFYTGADAASDNLSVTDIKEKIDFAVIAPHNPKAMVKFAREYTAKKIPYLFDPGMQLRWLGKDDLRIGFKGAEVIIGNDYEIEIMQQKTGITELHRYYPEKVIITTLGEKGSRLSLKGETVNVQRAKVKSALDPAGAGDAYRSGFLAGFLRKLPLKTCGQMGSVAAAYTVEKYGTTTHTFTLAGFKKRYRENFSVDLKFP